MIRRIFIILFLTVSASSFAQQYSLEEIEQARAKVLLLLRSDKSFHKNDHLISYYEAQISYYSDCPQDDPKLLKQVAAILEASYPEWKPKPLEMTEWGLRDQEMNGNDSYDVH